MRTLIALLLVLADFSYGPSAFAAEAPPDTDVNDLVVWSVNEYIQGDYGIELAAQVPSQVLLRPWFKWANAHDYAREKWVIPRVHANGQLFGGGLTMSAVYRGENGIDEKTFLDLTTRTPSNKLYPAFGRGDYYHGTLSNPRYVDYCLKWAFQQIDAGVDHLFMDEVNAVHGPLEGYDDYAIKDFGAWLLSQYDDRTPTDDRWRSLFAMPRDDDTVGFRDSLARFHYREYLKSHNLTKKPWTAENRLLPMWAQFKSERDGRVWEDVCDRIRLYARGKGRRVLIAANGLNRYVDHQIQNLWRDHLCLDRDERIDASRSLYRWAEGQVVQSRSLLGRDVPIVVFHDWGFGMPWQTISVEARNLWLRVYAPELYAAGVYFAFPVHGPFGCDSQKDGTLPTIQQMAGFFRRYAEYYRVDDRSFLDASQVDVSNDKVTVSLVEKPKARRRLIHFVNHSFIDGRMKTLDGIDVGLPSIERPKRLTVVSPDREGEQAIRFEHEDGVVSFRLPPLEYYDLAVLEYETMTPAADGQMERNIVIAPRPFWARASLSRFMIGEDGRVPNPDQICAYVHGNYHPQLRNNPTFVVDYARTGKFEVHVNSVATQGAVLEVHVDGKPALRETIADRDKRNDAFAGEIEEVYAVVVPQGRHFIRVDNTGGDWLTVDRYIFRNALESRSR